MTDINEGQDIQQVSHREEPFFFGPFPAQSVGLRTGWDVGISMYLEVVRVDRFVHHHRQLEHEGISPSLPGIGLPIREK